MSAEALAHRRLGNELYRQRNYAAALAAFDRSLGIEPVCAAALNNRGVALLALREPAKALETFEKAIRIQTPFVEALYNRGNALRELNRWPEALLAFDAVIAHRPDHADALNNRANVLQALGRPLEALEAYDKAIARRPSSPDAVENKAILLTEFGQIEAARQLLEAVVRVDPRRARAHYHLVRIKRMTRQDPQFAVLESLAQTRSLVAAKDAIDINFALGKAYDDVGEHERAFASFREGNALKRAGMAYNEAATLRRLREIARIFNPDVMKAGHDSPRVEAGPIFILGMPRSGSSLIEQILSRHPDVAALGETDAFETAASGGQDADGQRSTSPGTLADLSPERLRGISQRYRETLGAGASGGKRATNKQPSNFLHLGLIHLSLPGARLIHARRDPVDTCWSCFTQRFGDFGSLPCAYDLGELGRYYRAYDALMAHWLRVLPEGAILTVDYEDVVADVAGQTRRILDFCGLDWNPDCLDFQNSERQVRTASALQVRQPLYNHSVGRWRRYEPFLAPLLNELAGLA